MLLYNKLVPNTAGISTLVSCLGLLLVEVSAGDATSPQAGADPLCYGEQLSEVAISLDGDVVRRPDRTETTTHARSSHADGQCNQERARPPCCIAAGFSPEI